MEQERVQHRLIQRHLEDLHITRGPGRCIRVGSPAYHSHWLSAACFFMSPMDVLCWLDFKKTTVGLLVGGRLCSALLGQVVRLWPSRASVAFVSTGSACFSRGLAANGHFVLVFSLSLNPSVDLSLSSGFLANLSASNFCLFWEFPASLSSLSLHLTILKTSLCLAGRERAIICGQ